MQLPGFSLASLLRFQTAGKPQSSRLQAE